MKIRVLGLMSFLVSGLVGACGDVNELGNDGGGGAAGHPPGTAGGGAGGSGGAAGGRGGGAGTAATTGTAGTSGTTGAAGTTGTAGASGAAGTSGVAGASGTSGNTGAAGASGTIGTAGRGGTTGTTGAGGTTGTAGTSTGTSGVAGASGSAGAAGAGGVAGRGGTTGAAGTAGLAGRGGTGGGGTSGGGTSGSNGAPTWTVLVYANADNNLGPNLFEDILEMAAATLTPNVRLLLYADYPGGDPVPGTNVMFPAGSELARVMGGGTEPQTVLMRPEEDMDDPAVLTNAVSTAFRMYPADHYGLVLWDHGGAWRFGFGGDEQNGTRSGRPMGVQTVAGAVRAGIEAAGLRGTPPLEFLAFDTCLLGSPEVAAAFTGPVPLTRTFIGDAEIDYGAGWDYQGTMTWLAAHPTATALDFAKQEVMLWDAHHTGRRDDLLFRSHMALDTTRLDAFTSAVSTLVTAARTNGGAVDVARAFDLALPDYYIERLAQEQAPVPLKDMGQILTKLSSSQTPAIANAASAALTASRQLVLAQANGIARVDQGALNVGAGIPLTFTPEMITLYRTLTSVWNGASHWADLLEHLRAASDNAGPTIAVGTLSSNNRNLNFQINDGDLLSFDINLARLSADRRTARLLQMLNRSYTSPGAYQYQWSGRILAIDARPAPVLVTLIPWREIAVASEVQIPIYRALGSIDGLSAELLVDVEGRVSHTAILYNEDGLSNVFPLETLTGAVFWPEFPTADLATGAPGSVRGTTSVTISSGSVGFTAITPPSGGYVMSLRAKDTWGNENGQRFPFDIP